MAEEKGMVQQRVTVNSLIDGSDEEAALLLCGECESDNMIAILIGKERSMHLQCVNCGTMYCQHDSPCHGRERHT